MYRKLQEFYEKHHKWINGAVVPVVAVLLSMAMAKYIASSTASTALEEKLAGGHVLADYVAYRFFHMFHQTVRGSRDIAYTKAGHLQLPDCKKRHMYRSVIKELGDEMVDLLKNPLLTKKDEVVLRMAVLRNEIGKELRKKEGCSVSRHVMFHMCKFVPEMEERPLSERGSGQSVRRPRIRRKGRSLEKNGPLRDARYSVMRGACDEVKFRRVVDVLGNDLYQTEDERIYGMVARILPNEGAKEMGILEGVGKAVQALEDAEEE